MRIITINLNGIRSAARKGFFAWVEKQQADIICLQETRAHCRTLCPGDSTYCLPGYYTYFSDATKKGYSGVGIYTKLQPKAIKYDLGWFDADDEGRYVQIDFANLSVASLYLPSGTTGEHRQSVKYDFMEKFSTLLQQFARNSKKREVIICGDWNIAHKEIDLKNWRTNQNHTGFLPAERAWLDQVFGEFGLVDAFRSINQQADQYTWWSNFGKAWEKNIGWRIDYQVVTAGLRDKIKSASIYKDQRFSDHAPLIMDYDYDLS